MSARAVAARPAPGLEPRDEHGCHLLHVRVAPGPGEVGPAVPGGVVRVLLDVTALVEPSSEGAFVDVSGARHRFGRPTWIASLVRERVRRRAGAECSVGVAATKSLAELASADAAPDGVLLVPRGAGAAFLHGRRLEELPGVPGSTVAVLLSAGVVTVGDLAAVDVVELQREFGAPAGRRLHDLALGRDPRPVRPSVLPVPGAADRRAPFAGHGA